jgi:glutathione S-transferase
VEEAMRAVTAQLSQGPYMIGERFSGADVLYATSFVLFARNPVLSKSPLIEDYAKRVVARPAFARAMAKQNG